MRLIIHFLLVSLLVLACFNSDHLLVNMNITIGVREGVSGVSGDTPGRRTEDSVGLDTSGEKNFIIKNCYRKEKTREMR